ncbi:GNAT family N-acetyltransferase [Aldersonia kunmingensis]|uniref:GNAT family N-acetyltransferase n=1 Tax=Aldersonia kunmingensis TaxID=408066 RepID=UPI0008330051|nr:GNAT family N-acetyltransferase [Aldersonia kunmingensis]
MIAYGWCGELAADDRDEVLTLIRRAADYDAEAGFSAIDPSAVDAHSSAEKRVWHLPIRARRDLSAQSDTPWIVVAYLHLEVDADGFGSVQFVVDPDYRSRGIATLLVEELGLDTTADGGWAGTGARVLREWAYGTHPAAERLTARFAVPAVRRQWTLLRHLSGPWAAPLEPLTTEFAIAEPAPFADVETALGAVLSATAIPARHRETLSSAVSSGSVVVASEGGEPVGFVRFDPALHEHEGLSAARLGALVVADRASGKGLGSALLTQALTALRDCGAQLALMRIDPEDERAVRMCRLLSFEQEEAHTCYQIGEIGHKTNDDMCHLLTTTHAAGSVL